MENKKSYYAIIPANVRYDESLTPNAKLLYGEITALCNERGYCWAGNSYFSELYGVSNKSISRWISQLVEKGYLTSEMKYKEGGKEILHRHLRIASGPTREGADAYGQKLPDPMDKIVRPYGQKLPDPMDKKVKDNTTSNTTSNNTVNNKRKTDSKLSDAQLKSDFEELWKKYPNKQGKQSALKNYKKAIKEGTTKEEISKGIDNFLQYCNQNKWYTPAHGSTWFGNKRWEDDYTAENQTDNNSNMDWLNDTDSLFDGSTNIF